ncbi:hypothetical protein [Nocardia harenae]|uniref:hypothetical protein n=1 Tax=Nocardia harenae TaxID=358707 RepID=UPI00082BD06A|nr:hypothetical protein [Nocardia harenae]
MAAGTDYFDSLSEYGEILTPANVAQFLATRNWTIQRDRTVDQVWSFEPGDGARPVTVLLPREPSFVDYDRRLHEAITSISRTYGYTVTDLVEQIAAIHADLFFIRVDQSMTDGTIPLRQATALLDSIDQMIRVAAVSAHNPQASGRGRVPEYVTEFLNEDVRMGHTKKGSFIITVAARIEPDDHTGERPHAAAGKSAPSYTRRVMTTLARSLDITRRFANHSSEFSGVDQAVAGGLRLQVVQALQEMGATEGMRALELSFEWAAAEPQREQVPRQMSLDRRIIDALPEIERLLVRHAEPRRITIVGPVMELKQSDDDGVPADEQGGEIVVHADVGGRLRRIAVPLGAADHEWAIVAYRKRLPFTATGELVKRGNAWRLNDPIEVDRSYLQFRVGETRPGSER